MEEREHELGNKEELKDAFGVDLERRKEMMDLDAELVVRRCLRKKLQPRELLKLKFDPTDPFMIGRYSEEKIHETLESVDNLRDYDLKEKTDYEQAVDAVGLIFNNLAEFEFADQGRLRHASEGIMESMKNQKEAGILQYELRNKDGHISLMIHVPPQAENLTRGKLREARQRLAEVVKNDVSIEEIEGSSLLLEHPLVRKLGFEIDQESDEGFTPNFHMAREEFLERFTH
ncbi:MAG: hypothetical protein WC528_00945 [Patescibacteria group bacterium]